MQPNIDTYKNAMRSSVAVPYLGALKRSPVNTIALSVAGVALPIINAAGIAGATGLPTLLCFPIGGWMLAKQVDAFLNWRNRRGSRLKSGGALVGISAINMISIAAGLAAYDADALGQRLTARQLDPIIAAARDDAGKLERAAAASAVLAEYSTQRAKVEGATGEKWTKTCPNSTGPDRGPITEWRESTASAADQNSKRLKAAAKSARTAANRAEKAQGAYSVATHEAIMDAIRAELAAIELAISSSVSAGPDPQIEKLIMDGLPTGICPDAPLVDFAQRLLKANQFSASDIKFVPPPIPDESVAVHDLAVQLSSIPSGDADLQPYARYLILSPIFDLILISMLASLLGPALRNFHRETVQRKGLPDETTAEQLDAAYQAAARDPRWLALEKNEKKRRRWGILERMYIDENDTPALAHARDLVACNALWEGGPDGNGNIVFTLRPHFRPALWLQLVHRSMSSAKPQQADTPLYVIAAE